MDGYKRCVFLALVYLLLCHDSLAAKSTACTTWTLAPHKRFLRNHIPKNTPTLYDAKDWNGFLKKTKLTSNPQSFLMYDELNDVMDVCKDSGGRQYTGQSDRVGQDGRDDLCISKKQFVFIEVDDGRTEIVERYLILGCAMIEGDKECKPVHFEGNPYDHMPNDEDKGCKGGLP